MGDVTPGGEKEMGEGRGFTKKILHYLIDAGVTSLWCHATLCRFVISSEHLLKIAEMLNEQQLSDRQNDAPRIIDFVEVAKKEPNALFECYVVLWMREDERFAVEGVVLPAERQDLADELKAKALAPPDEEGSINADVIHMWWD
jgi:hypothetical protein